MIKLDKDTVFLIMSLTPWDYQIGNNAKDIAFELSKEYKTVYINIPTKRLEYYNGKSKALKNRRLIIAGKQDYLQRINNNLLIFTPPVIIESINWIKIRFLFNVLNYFNNYRFYKSIKKVLNELNIVKYIVINDNDVFNGYYAKKFINPQLYIYYLRDNLSAISYWQFHVSNLEPKLISRSDIVLCNSAYLQEYSLKYNAKSYFIGQGCNVDLFSNIKVASKIFANLKMDGPKIGYAGACLSIRLDIQLIERLAIEKPEWNFVFVGPQDQDFKSSRLHQLNNVTFTGAVDISELPEYINKFDVCINPQLLNDLTIGNYPRKIDEYLCLGKPTVATRTKAMEMFEDHVYLAENTQEYINKIYKALAENNEENRKKRIAYAKSHSWKNNVINILSKIKSEEV